MLFIIISHYFGHGMGGIESFDKFSIQTYIVNLSNIGGLGVCIFILISGYHLINSNKIKLTKLIHLLFEYYFINICCFIIAYFLGIQSIDLRSLYYLIFGIFLGNNWFICCYILLYLFHPFINKLLKSLSTRNLTILMLLLFVCWNIITTLPKVTFESNNLITMIMYYCYGCFLYLVKDKCRHYNKKTSLLLISFSSILLLLSGLIIGILSIKYNSLLTQINYFYSTQSILVLGLSTGLVSFASQCKPFSNKYINSISSLLLGVYLIHDNIYLKSYVWNTLFHVKESMTSNSYILYSIYVVIVVYLACLFILYLKKITIEKLVISLINKTRLSNINLTVD